MTTVQCSKSGRKHTPIVSEQQRKLFGAVASGRATKASGLSKAEAIRHLKESKGKSLPEMVEKSTKGSPSFTESELSQGYRKI